MTSNLTKLASPESCSRMGATDQIMPMTAKATRIIGSAAAGCRPVRKMLAMDRDGARAKSQSTINTPVAVVDHGSETATATASQSAISENRVRSKRERATRFV